MTTKTVRNLAEITEIFNSTSNNVVDVEVVEKDKLYYLASVIIQVEDRLFQVPQYFLAENSKIWKNALSFVPESGKGLKNDNPIVLQGIEKEDFRRMLELLLPLHNPALCRHEHFSKDDWVSVLRLAKMWYISDARVTAIKNLSRMQLSSAEKVVLGREYHVVEWMRSGYEELVQRSSFLTDEETKQIGWMSTVSVCRAREEVRPEYVRSFDVPDVVSKMLDIELKAAHHGSLPYLFGCH